VYISRKQNIPSLAVQRESGKESTQFRNEIFAAMQKCRKQHENKIAFSLLFLKSWRHTDRSNFIQNSFTRSPSLFKRKNNW